MELEVEEEEMSDYEHHEATEAEQKIPMANQDKHNLGNNWPLFIYYDDGFFGFALATTAAASP